ncbi:MAG: FKBP-type peptidyl-prolyl cis-trans isomerase [Bacteroidetes bacterium]|nr:FKBP-type peptidyl-prolyl cis-trans isomerase [Bacteroidota bacterium]
MLRSIFFLLIFLIVSCGEQGKPKKQPISKQQMHTLSLQMNTWDEKRQNDEINQYIKNHNWQMQETPTGLRYMFLKKGNGEQAKSGMFAKVYFKIYLLDGTVCYETKKDSAKEFLIGEDYVEYGIHEGIQLMHVGDQARFILPSHLAQGLTGDEKKIPPLSSVVYEVELISLRKKE